MTKRQASPRKPSSAGIPLLLLVSFVCSADCLLTKLGVMAATTARPIECHCRRRPQRMVWSNFNVGRETFDGSLLAASVFSRS